MPPKRKSPQDSDPDYPDSSAKRREIFLQTSSAPFSPPLEARQTPEARRDAEQSADGIRGTLELHRVQIAE
ncbi:hypothetical protein DFH09DRAFT_1289833 [Mycena vulgaris]|nr:hypothetical protein DFH09DRAFT_1289833 [Mycena vulgaris]